MTTTRRIFLASSEELKDDRRAFELFIGRKNKDWVARGVFLHLIVWEDFLDALSPTRLQDEYNHAIRDCDIFLMLFFSKVGRYTGEEFETAFGQFQATRKPFIFTYFKNAPLNSGSAKRADLESLWAFQDRLKALGHFQTEYQSTAGLLLHFSQQLDKLVANGFIEFTLEHGQTPAGSSDQAKLTGNGAIAQGKGATAVGAGGVFVGGRNQGSIHTGGAYVGGNVSAGRDFIGRDRMTVRSGTAAPDLEALFAPLLASVMQQAPPPQQADAVQQVQQLKAEVAKDRDADDSRIGKLIDGLVALVPCAVKAVLSTFATPILGGVAGPVTKYVLDKLKGS